MPAVLGHTLLQYCCGQGQAERQAAIKILLINKYGAVLEVQLQTGFYHVVHPYPLLLMMSVYDSDGHCT